jgi:hypothetical protein
MSIYHLHIPRTAGIYINNNVLPHLISNGIPHFASNRSFIEEEKIKNAQYVGGHFGIMPIELMDSPDVFSIVRNPVDRFVSYFKYTTGLIRTKSQAYQKLDSWLYGDQLATQSNLQSKFLTGGMDISKFNPGVTEFQKAVNNGWFIENYSLDINTIKNHIDKYNVYTIQDYDIFKEDFNKALNSHFGFTTFKHKDKANESDDIGIQFTKSQINRIEELNSIDMEMYDYVQTIKKRY